MISGESEERRDFLRKAPSLSHSSFTSIKLAKGSLRGYPESVVRKHTFNEWVPPMTTDFEKLWHLLPASQAYTMPWVRVYPNGEGRARFPRLDLSALPVLANYLPLQRLPNSRTAKINI